MVATLIEAFGNNFNNVDKCNNCDSRIYRVKSCTVLNNNQSLCENALAQDPTLGTSQNCKHDGKYCTSGSCFLGDPTSIDSNCKLQPTGNLSAPICTGSKLNTYGDYCLEPPLEQSYIRSIMYSTVFC